MSTAAPAIDPRELEDRRWSLRATEIAALMSWARGSIDRVAFRRWLRSEGWKGVDLDEVTVLAGFVLERLRVTERDAPVPAAR
jgi:hypothetical protein